MAQSTIDDDEMIAHVGSAISSLPVSDAGLQQIMEAQDEDPVCSQIKVYCYEGWPDKYSLKDALKPYWSSRGQLSVVQNILLKASRIVIPSSMRLDTLDKIHEGHQRITKCRERAKSSVWYLGLSREIQDSVQQCRVCAWVCAWVCRDSKPEPLIPTPLPDRPWQVVATDLFELKGVDYLIVIDYFSRYVEVAVMTKTTKSSEVIRALKSIFARHGTPEQVRSDNGPQFDSAEFLHFAKEWGFKHTTSSPRFPQSNGEVERGVRTVKNLITKEKDPAKGLLAYRSTPQACKFSPAQLLMGRQIRGTPRLYVVETPTSTLRRNRAHLTPMLDQQQQHRPTPAVNNAPAETRPTSPMQTDIPNLQVPPVTPILASRPKRIIKP